MDISIARTEHTVIEKLDIEPRADQWLTTVNSPILAGATRLLSWVFPSIGDRITHPVEIPSPPTGGRCETTCVPLHTRSNRKEQASRSIKPGITLFQNRTWLQKVGDGSNPSSRPMMSGNLSQYES